MRDGERDFNLEAYLTQGVERLVKDALRATMRDPRESAFMARFAAAAARAGKRRERWERDGLHVPSYLIASITSRCNLHCAGCYSRANRATEDCAPSLQLSDGQWLDIFAQAQELGVSFILLAGGEPLLRRDIIEQAGRMGEILFPIFTNGTFLDEHYLELFDRCRNLMPVMSLEGSREITDARRGEGVYERLMENMEALRRRHLLFGCSVTVTTENLEEVLSDGFVSDLAQRGCKALLYIE